MSDYDTFLRVKLAHVAPSGWDATVDGAHLFAYQQDLVRWALRRGKAAVFASTGLGKTRMELEWARQVATHTGGRVLVLTPLAVAAQMSAEGTDIGIDARVCREQSDVTGAVSVTNYDRLHRFDPSAFAGVVLDESSCIKHYNSKTLTLLLEAFGATPFRLAATATPAPNDWTELGTQMGRRFVGAELKASYYGQAVKNLTAAKGVQGELL